MRKNYFAWRRMLTAMIMMVMFTSVSMGKEYTYDFLSSIPEGWSASVAPFGFETTNSARGTQFTSSSELTLKGAKDVTKVVVTYSTNNTAEGNAIALSVNGTSWGTEAITKVTAATKEFSGTTATGDIVLSITRSAKSVYISQIVVTASEISGSAGGTTGGDEGGDEGDDTTLDPNYSYAEPTTIAPSGATCSNQSYTFIQNNIQVTTTTGAQTETYFGCNAGQSITFKATKEIKGIVINGYVKKDFDAEASAGEIGYVDASEDAVEANPVLAVINVDSKELTISCVKQLRCYSVDVYFDENPDIEIGGGDEGDYTYEYEPTTQTTVIPVCDRAFYISYADYFDFDYTELYFDGPNFMVDFTVFAPAVKGTGIAPGTYPVNFTYENGTMEASPGGDDEADYPSFIATDFDDEGYYSSSYYIVDGALTVAADPAGAKYTFSGTTYYGSKVDFSYTGAIANYMGDDDEDGVDDINASRPAASKFVRNGRVLIQKDGREYNTTGQRVKSTL